MGARRAATVAGLLAAALAGGSLASSPVGVTYTDWDGALTCRPEAFLLPASEEAIALALREAAAAGQRVKVVGAGHSFSGIQMLDSQDAPGGVMLSLDRWAGIVAVTYGDQEPSLVEVRAGTRLRDLNTELERRGLALENLGATAAQSVVGACATGTHGTGRELGSMATAIQALRIIDAQGNVVVASAEENAELFAAARVSLGALGVVSTVTVRVVPMFHMRKTVVNLPLEELLQRHDELYAKYERMQWSWVPYSHQASLMVREVVSDEVPITGCWDTSATNQSASEGIPSFLTASTCVDVSYKTLVDSNEAYGERTLYTEMEMFIPVEHTVAAVRDLLAWQESIKGLHNERLGTPYSMVRYVAADNITLSPIRGRDVAVLSTILMGNQNRTAAPKEFALFARGMEKICKEKYQGVPHWGKKNWATREDLAPFYGEEAYASFEKMRERLDPEGIFLNDYLVQRGIGATSA